jgi:8-oxo-dGTP pyrophosphatase MutT (NUDIX family)
MAQICRKPAENGNLFMYLKVYFGDKPVYLCNEIDAGINAIMHHPDAVFIDEISVPALKSLMHEIVKPDFHAGVIWHADLEALRKQFWKHFTIVPAAGGLVDNGKGEYLMIFRKGSWDLPKGKLDKGETLEECAVREVQEETGLKHIKLGEALATTYHTYTEFGKPILKESYWYWMQAPGKQKMKPQLEEGISEIIWADPANVQKLAPLSYPSIRELLTLAGLFTPSA